ncbi:MAG: hypothetical protein ABH800_01570 [Candidatus Nealsonbacteria bacterium]
MVRKIIERVTITGADDSVDPEDLLGIAEKYPFVEFGILLSKKRAGSARFPSFSWLEKLCKIGSEKKMILSGHICGVWVREFCLGNPSFFQDCDFFYKMFDRLQLNFHSEFHNVDPVGFCKLLLANNSKQFIFQIDNVNNKLLRLAKKFSKVNAAALFDLSGGTGILPKEWPKARSDCFCGYAGGLGPENIEEQMKEISKAAGDNLTWVDSETKLRSPDNTKFLLEKAESFLKKNKPWVVNGE